MKVNLLNCPACNSPLDSDLSLGKPCKCPACGSTLVLTEWTKTDQIPCTQCGAVNASTNQFCEVCNTALQTACPFCYTQNSVTSVNCKHCGANLQRARKRREDWIERREKARHEVVQKAAEGEAAYLGKLLLQLNEPANHRGAIPGIRIFGKEAVEPLIELLTSADPDARFGAAKALGDIGDRTAILGLIHALNDPEGAVRFWALDALGKLKAEEAVEAIGNLLQDKHESIKKLAKEVLMQIGTSEARRVLMQRGKLKWWQTF